MSIREARIEDVLEIVRIHLVAFPRGLLSFFGESYLIQMYKKLVADSEIGLVVVDSDSVVRGFVFSECDFSAKDVMTPGVLRAILANISACLFVFLPIVISRMYLMIKVFFLSGKKAPNALSIELAYIAMDANLRSQGIGRSLIQAFENIAMTEKGYSECNTRTHNSRLTNFYVKNKGAEILYEVNTWQDYSCVLKWSLN